MPSFYVLKEAIIILSREELGKFKAEAIDAEPIGEVRRRYDNVDLTDIELINCISERVIGRKPVYLLLLEYERRLQQRSMYQCS